MESTSARDLDRRLAELVRSERHLVAQFVIELAGFAKQELYRELGYTSLFYYCVRQLGLSKSSAFRRAEVARLIVRFPEIAERLAAGRLSVRAMVELREVLTEENHAVVLARAEGKSQEEAQLLAVELRPRPVPRDVVRNLVSAETRAAPRPPEGVVLPGLVVSAGTSTPPQRPGLETSPGAVVSAETEVPPQRPEAVKPLTRELRRLNVTVSAEFIAELEQVRAALSHTCPEGGFEEVVRAAFKLVLERDRKRKALTGRPLAQRPPLPRPPGPESLESQSPGSQSPGSQPLPGTSSLPLPSPRAPALPPPRPQSSCTPGPNDRYVPAAVKRAVWERDRGRCTWPMGDGQVCGATHRLELDHDLEVALGGKPTFENIRVLCKSHNLLKAEEHLGRAFMAKFRERPPAARGDL